MSRLLEGAANVKVIATTTATTAIGTVASGFAQFVGIIPDDIGKMVSVIGGLLSIVMIQYWRANKRKVIADTRLIEMQLRIKELELRRLEKEVAND